MNEHYITAAPGNYCVADMCAMSHGPWISLHGRPTAPSTRAWLVCPARAHAPLVLQHREKARGAHELDEHAPDDEHHCKYTAKYEFASASVPLRRPATAARMPHARTGAGGGGAPVNTADAAKMSTASVQAVNPTVSHSCARCGPAKQPVSDILLTRMLVRGQRQRASDTALTRPRSRGANANDSTAKTTNANTCVPGGGGRTRA